VTITAMGMGQAAGAAAALALHRRAAPREVSVAQLQDRLRQQGAILEAPR
jgi:FAD dependent oxidoreductase